MSIAHGTIAIDTLTTSDQVNTGTEKSIDTSYVFNGVMKAWMYYKQNIPEISDSFNTSTATDTATGNYLHNYTNVFAGSYDFRILGGTSFATDKFLSHGSTGSSTSATQHNVYDIICSGLDDSFSSPSAGGDLA